MHADSEHDMPMPHGNGTVKVCVLLPPKINSAGLWVNIASPSVILNYSLPLLELQMLLLFFVTQLVYVILKPLGFQLLPSQIIVGFILGPVMLGKLETVKALLYTPDFGLEIVDTTAVFGFTLFIFLMGVKMDVRGAFRTAKSANVIGFLSLLSPFLVGLAIQKIFEEPNQPDSVNMERFTIITSEALTSVSVIACLLSELKILNSELGRQALSSAIVGNVSGLVLVFCRNFYKNWRTISHTTALVNSGAIILFVIVLVFVLRPLMFLIIKRTPEGRPVKDIYIFIVTLLAFGSSLYAHCFNLSPLFGAFLFGLAVPDGPPLGSALVDKFECFVSGAFLPVYVTTATMRADPVKMLSFPVEVRFATVVGIASFLAKFIGCFIASFYSKMPMNDSLAFALIMSSKGIVELSFFSTFRDNQFITEASFTVMIISILLNSAIIPILVKFFYDPISRKYAGYQKRNIMHLKPNTELRILACVHKPDNVAAVIGLLNATGPTPESPNVVYVLHLIELMGRDSPIFIAHKKQGNAVVRSSYEKCILAFNQYEQNNWGLVTVNAFTAISPAKLMHEDICTLALDKQTSFILLPFHRKWSIDGSIEAEHNAIRNLNCSVLERAPCSVGILVDRGSMHPSRLCGSSFCIGMIFLGGKDDREALTLAKRMSKAPKVNLNVIHFVEEDRGNMMLDWDKMLDDQVLKDVKRGDDNIIYTEEVVRDGPQAAMFVRSIVDGYDLIIVGRRYGVESGQTSGLSDWSEFPELGIIGDLLASTDLQSTTSVLVVQQQNYVEVDRR